MNFAEWRAHVFGRLALTFKRSGDPGIVALIDELERLPRPLSRVPREPQFAQDDAIVVPMKLETDAG